jgi:TolB-like protein/Tfp pilus assembly protein PilF
MDGKTTFGPFVLDRERQRLTRDGRPVPVGHRGYVLLETLLEAGGNPVSKEALMERAWPGTVIEEGSLTVQISALRRQLGEGSDAMIVTVPRVGYRVVAQPERTIADRGGPPLIAVLPFANHGSAADDGYFANGVVDDIITALARFKSFAVLSRGSSFALREKGTDARASAAELGVRYALEGSIRRMDGRLRVTAQLLDVGSGKQLWAQRYDGPVAEIFSFQDRITENVVGVIEPQIRQAEIERARRKPAANLDAYDLFLKALPIFYEPGIERHAEAISLLDGAMELDPGFALPPAYAAEIYEARISRRSPPLGDNDAARAIELARKALRLGGDDPVVRAICAWVLFRVEGDLSAVEAVRRALEDNPNHVTVLQHAAAVVGMHGEPEEAFRYHARAYELSPGGPEAYDSLFGMAGSELVMGNNEAAIEWALKSLATFNHLLFTYITLTAAYANLDRMEEARAMLRKVREDSPHLTLKLIEDGVAKEDSFAWAVLPGLRKAGLPER